MKCYLTLANEIRGMNCWKGHNNYDFGWVIFLYMLSNTFPRKIWFFIRFYVEFWKNTKTIICKSKILSQCIWSGNKMKNYTMHKYYAIQKHVSHQLQTVKKNRKLEFISNQFSLDKWRNRCEDPVMLCTGPTRVHVNNLMQIDTVHSICSITWWNGISIWIIDSLDDEKIQLATILIVTAWNPSENISAFLLRPYNH